MVSTVPESSAKNPGRIVHESVYSLAWKIILLQVMLALLLIVLTVLLRTVLLIADTGPVLNFSLLPIIIGLQTLDMAVVIYLVIQWRSVRYLITPQEIVITRGTLDVSTEIYKTTGIEKVEVRQSALGKLFNYGTVSLFHPALGSIELVNIPTPGYYARLIEQQSQIS